MNVILFTKNVSIYPSPSITECLVLFVLFFMLFSRCHFSAVVTITSFASSYANVNTEQQQIPTNCSSNSNNKNSSEQTTTDESIFDFLARLPRRRLLANNILRTNRIHTPIESEKKNKKNQTNFWPKKETFKKRDEKQI